MLNAEQLRRILEPEPGTALWRAKEYGIDLTLVAQAVQKTPVELMERAERGQRMMAELAHMRAIGRRV